jgi:DNA-binding NarL/FixJ family response regulator
MIPPPESRPPVARTRVSVVEDDEPTRRILAEVIGSVSELELVSQYGSTPKAVEALPRDGPDVVLMDINMPVLNGIDCVERLKPQMPRTQFLMLTVYEDTDHIFAALAAGATGYLLKSTRRTDLLEAIAQIVAGGSPMSSGIARKVVQSFSEAKAKPSAAAESLSPREQSVLALLSKGYLYKEIAESLGVSVPTVNTYIRRIYDKLQVHSRTQAVARYLDRG